MRLKLIFCTIGVFSCLFGFTQSTSEAKNIDALLDNTFKIICYQDNKISKTGSGFILFKNKKYYCITNEHVLEASDSAIIVFQTGETTRINYIIATNHKLDACIFSIDLVNSRRLGLINKKN